MLRDCLGLVNYSCLQSSKIDSMKFLVINSKDFSLLQVIGC